MIRWKQSDLEQRLECRFHRLETEIGTNWQEARFSTEGLQFILIIDAERDWIWLRSDPSNPDQATPAFEFTFRCDRILITPGGYDSEAIRFDFTNGCDELRDEHIRLVIDRIPGGSLYIYPILGSSDPPYSESTKQANKMATQRKSSDQFGS